MAIHYSGTTIGTFTLYQPEEDMTKEEYAEAKDEKGRTIYNKFKVQIRLSNCFALFLHVYKVDNPENPEKCWCHQLVSFFVDEAHLKRCMENYDKDFFKRLFSGELRNIKLNIYYKEMEKLAKYMAKDGLKVQCYYKEPKKQASW